MGIIPKVRCRRCNREFSGLRSKCPYCGTRKAAAPTTRTAATAASTVRGSASSARAAQNAKYQMIFGTVIMLAIVLALIVLITTSLKGGDEEGGIAGVTPSPSPSADLIVATTPSPTPTETPAATDVVSSISFTFGGGPLAYENQFATSVGNTTQLGVNVYPLNPDAKVTWSSSDESILTVDQTGLVTALKTGWATITVSCGGVTASCDVWVQ